jgi:DNA-binding GntR family transcriptional regulator
MTRDGAPVQLGPARRRVLADEVADAVRQAIVSGELAAGDRLIEDELATQLGVSRGPVREALARLGLEGLVVNERHRGASVARLTADEVDEIYSLRNALERLAVDWVCRNAAIEELDDLGRVLERIESLSKPLDKIAVANLDLEFHDAVFRAAHHERLYRAWEGLRSQNFLFLIQGGALRADIGVSWRVDHEAFLAALRSGKRSHAMKVAEAHVNSTYQRVLEISATNTGGG